jgi:serine/alanine adding enzyme
MKIHTAANERDAKQWEEFALSFPGSSNYHRWGWKQVIERCFGWPTYYLMAEEDEKVRGILPLAWQQSWLFGKFLTSLPFFNCGGVAAETNEAKEALIQEAVGLSRRLGAGYLELRHRGDQQLGFPQKTNKVSVFLEVEPDEGKMMKSLRHEVRTKIRKAIKSGLTGAIEGPEALDDFYKVFAENMRDLGTPVYGKHFFQEIFRTFPSDTFLCMVRHQGAPVAGSLMTGFRDTLETIWGSSLRKYLSMAPNMLMYWRMVRLAAERGYRIFDFGRSSVGSGPHSFKLQWSSREIPLHWDYWLPEGRPMPEINPHNRKYALAIWAWQHLPLTVANWLGPKIVRSIP